jgi:hypothetical protein
MIKRIKTSLFILLSVFLFPSPLSIKAEGWFFPSSARPYLGDTCNFEEILREN